MWTPPATPNGDILRYKVYYATVDNSGNVGNEMVKTTADTSTELVINGLLVGKSLPFSPSTTITLSRVAYRYSGTDRNQDSF